MTTNTVLCEACGDWFPSSYMTFIGNSAVCMCCSREIELDFAHSTLTMDEQDYEDWYETVFTDLN